MHIILSFLLSFAAYSQHSDQPAMESNTDLRSAMVLFSIEQMNKEQTIWLERTPHSDHFLRMKKGKDEEVIKKVTTKDARALEMDFASRFLKCQYEIESLKGECQTNFRLTLKGEGQEICKKDERKSQEFESFLSIINKRFN